MSWNRAGATVATLVSVAAAALAAAAPASAWPSVNCEATWGWSGGAYTQSQTLVKPNGSNDPCRDINLQTTTSGYFQAYNVTKGIWYANTYVAGNQLLQALSPEVYGGNQFFVVSNNDYFTNSRIDY